MQPERYEAIKLGIELARPVIWLSPEKGMKIIKSLVILLFLLMIVRLPRKLLKKINQNVIGENMSLLVDEVLKATGGVL